MQITCFGAAGCVTGSCFLLDNGKKYLVDCGLFQGGREVEALNRREWGFNPHQVSALFLTHAHIDHCGRIPKLVKDGFKGKIYTTLPTAELCKILLLDSAHIQEMEAEWQSRKNRRKGNSEVQPLYTTPDAEACFPLFEVVERDEVVSLDENLKVCFRNAGHILGSSVLEVWSGPSASPFKTVFSGDLGRKDQLIVKDPHRVSTADALFVESTYGNRNHRSFEESEAELVEAIHYSYEHNEKVLIPAFAVERTQEVLYILGDLFRRKLIPSMPVYLDSPLAIAATEIFRKMSPFYDEEATEILNQGHHPFDFPQLVLSRSTEDSIAINRRPGAAIVIAGNGMCTAGRIKHHLKHNLWRQGCSLVIVGYQAVGSIGRRIIEGARTVKIFGEQIGVRARVFTIGGLSAHADQSELIEWIGHFKNALMKVYVIHGEKKARQVFSRLVHERFGLAVYAPEIGDIIPLALVEPEAAPIEIEELKWQRTLMKVIQRAEDLRALWEESPQALEPETMAEIEDELARTQRHLEKILKKASAEPGQCPTANRQE